MNNPSYKSSRYRASVKQLYEAVDYYCRMIRIIIRIEELRQRIDRDMEQKGIRDHSC
jgi:hypothetical protein